MSYLPPLDGIRAVAILAVLVFHVSPTALRGGFTGVDVFFVLSGFLITSNIVTDLREGCFSIPEFYLRRIQRLLPNIIVTILATLLLWVLFMPPSAVRSVGLHGLWALCNLSNLYIWKNLGGYWGDKAEWAPLTHTWSLGVEEQFYLIFPMCLLLLGRFQPKRALPWLIASAVFSFGLCLYGTRSHPAATFYLLPTRVWELLLGSVLAVYRMPFGDGRRHPPAPVGLRTREVLGWTGLAAIGVGFVGINEHFGFPGYVSLLPTIGTVLVLFSVTAGETGAARLLSKPFMTGVGKLSYSLYLWHWPLITLGKHQAGLHGFSLFAGAVGGGLISILLAWLAYVGVERPLRRRGPGRPRRLAAIAAGFAAVGLCSLALASRTPVADPAHRFDPLTFSGMLFNAGRITEGDQTQAVRYYDVHFPPQPPRSDDVWREGGIVHQHGGGHPKVVVLGSSHALMHSKLVDDLCRELGLSVAFLGVDGTPAFFETSVSPSLPSPSVAREFDETRRKWLREWHPDAVFVIDRWDRYAQTPQGFDRHLRSFLNEVSPLAGRVIFVAQVPVGEWGEEINLRELISRRVGKNGSLPRLDPDSKDSFRWQAIATIKAAVADFPNVQVLRADLPFYQNDGSIRYAAGRICYYADDDHLTDQGSELLRELFRSAIAGARSNGGAP